MKYGPSERYVSHVDYYDSDDSRFFGDDVTKFGGQRVMTALLYLTTCKGGETVFKNALKNNTVGLNSCANEYVTPPACLFPRWCTARTPALAARFRTCSCHFSHRTASSLLSAFSVLLLPPFPQCSTQDNPS
jgi:hypothetical protein